MLEGLRVPNLGRNHSHRPSPIRFPSGLQRRCREIEVSSSYPIHVPIELISLSRPRPGGPSRGPFPTSSGRSRLPSRLEETLEIPSGSSIVETASSRNTASARRVTSISLRRDSSAQGLAEIIATPIRRTSVGRPAGICVRGAASFSSRACRPRRSDHRRPCCAGPGCCLSGWPIQARAWPRRPQRAMPNVSQPAAEPPALLSHHEELSPRLVDAATVGCRSQRMRTAATTASDHLGLVALPTGLRDAGRAWPPGAGSSLRVDPPPPPRPSIDQLRSTTSRAVASRSPVRILPDEPSRDEEVASRRRDHRRGGMPVGATSSSGLQAPPAGTGTLGGMRRGRRSVFRLAKKSRPKPTSLVPSAATAARPTGRRPATELRRTSSPRRRHRRQFIGQRAHVGGWRSAAFFEPRPAGRSPPAAGRRPGPAATKAARGSTIIT